MTVTTRTQLDALAPLRRALLEAAEARAAALRRAAEEEADSVRRAGAERAEAILGQARRSGEGDGAARVALARAEARQEARTIILAARRAAYDGIRDRAVAAVADLLAGPRGRARLAALVEDSLGPGATIVEDPRGGLVGTTPDGRRVDASAGHLVDLVLARLDLEQLWAG